MYDKELADLISQGNKDTPAIKKVIDTLADLAEEARREGLLSLENKISGLSSPYLKLGVQLMVDGNEPDDIRRILNAAMYARDFTKTEQVVRILIREGILAIQSGMNPRVVYIYLSAFLGEEEALKSLNPIA
jgi:flagellar motor component MotA